tara:strand:- start:268 stop:462 length:195 start_codon:yes stop_codon:yes gene_type:complete
MKKQDKNRNWFDSHMIVMTLDNDKEKEKTIKSNLKKAFNKKFNNYDPEKSYKKAVNFLKKNIKK